MITYEYACDNCGHTWEEEAKISDPKTTTCPSCKENSAKRLISGGTGFQLLGGGWYKDGYSNKN
jgi:putative FmdB family regulatory protein